MTHYERRYPGLRWGIAYGSYEGVEQFAVDELQRVVQHYLPYVVEVRAAGPLDEAEHLLLTGTPANNRWIAELGDKGLISLPAQTQAYTIASLDSPQAKGKRWLVVAGADAPGVLYGVEELACILAAQVAPDGPAHLRECFDRMPGFRLSERPAIDNRGIWTWGYVIYDYRRFLDHMARLKLNMLTIWNDCPPVNCRQVIDYAHSRGVQVMLGFHWGWGLPLDLSNPEHRQFIKHEVLRNYRENYCGLGMGGIYFQTLTEHNTTQMGGRSTAALACELVNEVAGVLYAEDSALRIYFGLHATSIRESYRDLEQLDPRVTIVWEDAGVIPYAYDPLPRLEGSAWDAVNSPEQTLEFSQRLATFRPDSEFALVPKGWTTLRWGEEFEHHGSFILGERPRAYVRRRLEERQPRWDRVNTLWLENYRHAVRFYRAIRPLVPRMTAVALVEDGLFEERIQPSVALFAQMAWNPERDEAAILRAALNPRYDA